MLNIQAINHIGMRVRDKERSVAFYQDLGFQFIMDHGFEQGHPVVMQHASGVMLNLLGSTTTKHDQNILMDVPEKHAGYTHIALTVASLSEAKAFLLESKIAITGSFQVNNMSAIFFRDPDRNVIELDAYDVA